MKKVLSLVLGISVFLFASMTNFAFASVDANGVSLFITDNGSTTSKTTFDLSETPYLYVSFPGSFSALWKSADGLWNDPDGLLKGSTTDPFAGMNNWYTISNWNSVKKAGLWEVDTSYLVTDFFDEKNGGEKLNFSVTPEPISSALFLLGGGALALRSFRKRTVKKV